MQSLLINALQYLRANSELTENQGARWRRLFSECTFMLDIEGTLICDVSASIDIANLIAVDDSKVAVDEDDTSCGGFTDTKQPEI